MQIIIVLFLGLFSVFATAQDVSTTVPQDVKPKKEQEAKVQEAKPQEAMSTEPKTLRKIEVTGSYIKRVDEESPNPVQTITNETIKKSGYNSVADVLRNNALTTGGTRENSINGTPGASTAMIGPFESDSILVLLDGNRLPKIGGDNSVDLSLIPTAAIERIEVLKDGASATYGSDAIGGVINIITKKDYNGATINMGQSLAQAGGAARTDFSGAFGKTYKGGSFSGIMQYRNNSELASSDRSFTRISDLGVQGSMTSQVGQWTGTDNQNHFNSCPPDQVVDGTCMFDFSKYSWEMPKITQYSTLLNNNVKITANTKLKSQLNFTMREVETRLAPSPGKLKLTPADAQTYLGITNAAVNPLDGMVDVTYRTLSAGPRQNQDQTFAFSTAQSLEGKIAGSWGWDVTGSFAGSRRRQNGIGGYVDRRKLQEGIIDGSWMPLNPADQQGSLARAVFQPYETVQSQQAEGRAIATGQMTDNSSLAIGTSTAWQMYRSEVDSVTLSNNNFGGNGGNGFGTRNFQSLFTEASVFPVESVELGVAARYDTYSDFGNTFNPKVSASWQANKKLMLRTSVGTGFRAPNLSDLYNGGSLGYPYARDTTGCAAAGGTGPSCTRRQYEVATTANANLKQERSIFYNAGFVLQPKKNWTIDSNMFLAKIEDSVGSLDLTQVVRAGSIFGEDYLRKNYQLDIQRDASGKITRVNMLSAYNIASSIRQGIDFHVANQAKYNIGRFPIDVVVDVTHIQYLKIAKEEFPGMGLQNDQDNYYRDTLSVTAFHDTHSVRAAMRTISGQDKIANVGVIGDVGYGSLRAHTEFDLNYTKTNLFRKASVSIGVNNLFDTKRPLDDTNQVALNTDIYDPIGRYFYTNIGYTF